MANLEKLKKRLGSNFEGHVVKASERLRKISKDIDGDATKSGYPNVLRPSMVERHLENATSRIIDPSATDSALESTSPGNRHEGQAFEAIIAIVNFETRPPLMIVNDEVVLDGSYGIVNDYEHQNLLSGAGFKRVEQIAKSVGAVDLINVEETDYVGTGWLVAPDIAVTNRHVAKHFLEKQSLGNWKFKTAYRNGRSLGQIRPALNFLRQKDTPGKRQVKIIEPLYIASEGQADMAFFRVKRVDDVAPIEFETGKILANTPIVTVGYPAWDGYRNDQDGVMSELFGGHYSVKRFSPGEVDGIRYGRVILHDCSTLGGNSGSPVLNLETGKAIGLHYWGSYGEENRAVHAKIVSAAINEFRGTWSQGAQVERKKKRKPVRSKNQLRNRTGYNPGFLGEDSLTVPLPDMGDHAADLSPLIDDDGAELKYHHFSVLQSASRKLPRMTAVNIDGARLGKVSESNDWHFDPRISLEDQSGNELYKDTSSENPLDRGHMVRRLDPCWGRKSDIKKAQRDTYHYTNSAPQHLALNRRHWVGLEDYILDSAKARDFKVSVFTGPVFREDDPVLESGVSDVPIPREYWKIAVLVNKDTGDLSSAAYILSQGEMIQDFTEAAFVFGKYETYQVPVSLVQQHTGYDFGILADADEMANVDQNETIFASTFKRINGPGDI